METKRSTTTGRNITALALSATLATAGLGLTGLGATAWATEGAEGTVASAPADEAAGEIGSGAAPATDGSVADAPDAATPAPAAQVFPKVTPAAQTQKVTIELTDEATTAAQLYDAVNEARAAAGLPALERDAALEQLAWQRAAESVVLAGDVRPDGTGVDTIDATVKITGETLVAGAADKAGTAELALAAAQANTDGKSNLLSATHVGMGAALVRDAAGAYHWAIVYSDAPAAAADAQASSTTPADGTRTYTLNVPAESLTPASSTTQEAKVEVGATIQLAPGTRLQGAPFAEAPSLAFDATQPLALEPGTVSWESSDTAIATVDAQGKVSGVANGVAQVSATSSLGTASWNVTVGTGQAAEPAEPSAPEGGSGSEAGDAPEQGGAGETGTPEEGSETGDAPEQQPGEDAGQGATTPDATTPEQSAGGDAGASTTPEQKEKADLSKAEVLGITEVHANADGTPVTPVFSLAIDGVPVPEIEYTYEFSNNTKPGTATLTITAAADSNLYTGTLVKEFTIDEPARTNIAEAASIVPIDDQVFADAPVTPEPVVTLNADGATRLVKDQDYTVSYENNEAVGTATLTVSGAGAYEGALSTTFNIVEPAKVDLATSGAAVAPIEAQTHTGQALEPAPVVTLADGTVLEKDRDYTLSYANNIVVGENSATVTITGAGNYVGTLTATFSIVEAPEPVTTKDIAQATVEPIADQDYTGDAVEPKPVVKMDETTLVEGTDYTLAYADNVEAGEATVTITGTGAYEGTLSAKFVIVKPELINLRTAGFAIQSIPDQTLGDAAPEPTVVVTDGTTTLEAGKDYTVRYENNSAPGTARAVVTGTGAYTGVIDKAFKVVSGAEQRTSIKGARVSSIAAQSYTGSAIEPKVEVTLDGKTLVEGADYTLSYESNVNVGTARVVITGTGAYEGTIDATFVINALSLSQVEIIMPNQYATGSALTPKPVSVTAPSGYALVEGTDYDITGYLNNTKVGKAAVTLQGKGNFTGAVTAGFQIVEPGSTADAGKTNTLPKTGDATSIVPVAIAGVAGVALVGAGAALIARRRRENTR